MSDKTGISWTDATWNPVRGCSRVSAGCQNCYAERVAARFSDPGQPYHRLADRSRKGSKWTGEVRFVAEHLADPLHWKKPRRIFVNSMSDLFHEKLSNEQIAAVFGVMAAAPRHTFQILTKRALRMREWFEWVASMHFPTPGQAFDTSNHARMVIQRAAMAVGSAEAFPAGFPVIGSDWSWPLPNVWLGVSVENQATADDRIPHLLATPAAVRFLSCEPLLGALDLLRTPRPGEHHDWLTGERATALTKDNTARIDWVIAGCESGAGARPCDADWIRRIRDACADAGVALFVKQAKNLDGAYMITDIRPVPRILGRQGELIPIVGVGPGSHEKGGGVIELPYLDGVQHAEFPR